MRYEHIEMDLSTVACHELLQAVESLKQVPWGYSKNAIANAELANLANELRARLQRTDVDPHAVQKDSPDPSWDLTA